MATMSEESSSSSRRRKVQEVVDQTEEPGKARKKNKVVRRKMPKMRRARDGTLHARKEVRSIPEANKLRKAIPAMLRDQVKVTLALPFRLPSLTTRWARNLRIWRSGSMRFTPTRPTWCSSCPSFSSSAGATSTSTAGCTRPSARSWARPSSASVTPSCSLCGSACPSTLTLRSWPTATWRLAARWFGSCG